MGFHADQQLGFMLSPSPNSSMQLQKKKPNHNSQVTVTHLKEEVIAFRRMAVRSNIDQTPSAQTFVLDH